MEVVPSKLVQCRGDNFPETGGNLTAIYLYVNNDFFREWTDLCNFLRKEKNLHHELKNIANEYLGKFLNETEAHKNEDQDNGYSASRGSPKFNRCN